MQFPPSVKHSVVDGSPIRRDVEHILWRVLLCGCGWTVCVGCGNPSLPPPPSPPTVAPVQSVPAPLARTEPARPLPQPEQRGGVIAATSPSVTLWNFPHRSLLSTWELQTRQQKDRAEFEKSSRNLHKRLTEDRDALIDLLELEARLWHEVFEDRARQIDTLTALRQQFAQQAYDDAVLMGRNSIATEQCFRGARRRREARAVNAEFLKFPMCYKPFYEKTPNRYFGQPDHELHAEAALHAVQDSLTSAELSHLEIRHFAFGYIRKMSPDHAERLDDRGPTDEDRAFQKMTANFFRDLITKIPVKHPAVESALFVKKYE